MSYILWLYIGEIIIPIKLKYIKVFPTRLHSCSNAQISKKKVRKMSWSFTSDSPIYLQIAEIIKFRILRGEYPPGTRIPSVRELAQEAAVNPNTMQRALALLKSAGLLITRRTTGRTVTEHQELILLTRRTLAKEYVKRLSALDFSIKEINELMQEASKETT